MQSDPTLVVCQFCTSTFRVERASLSDDSPTLYCSGRCERRAEDSHRAGIDWRDYI